MSITPQAVQDLLAELESSKQSRVRAWEILQKLRVTTGDLGNLSIPSSKNKSFEAEGILINQAIAKALRERNAAILALTRSARIYIEVCTVEDRRGFFGGAHQSLLKCLSEAEAFLKF